MFNHSDIDIKLIAECEGHSCPKEKYFVNQNHTNLVQLQKIALSKSLSVPVNALWSFGVGAVYLHRNYQHRCSPPSYISFVFNYNLMISCTVLVQAN